MHSYFVSSVSGDDLNGTGSQEAPWRSLARLVRDRHARRLAPFPQGTQIFLERGSVFREPLDIHGLGTSGRPVVVDVYGEGTKPIVSAGHLISLGAHWKGPDERGRYRLTLGSTHTFYTTTPVLLRVARSGKRRYTLLRLGAKESLARDSYAAPNEGGQRTIYYRPPRGKSPAGFGFEISARKHAISVTGEHVIVRNLEAMLGNVGPTNGPISDATVIAEGDHVIFEGCTVRFGRSNGLAVNGRHSVVRDCLAEHNRSTGLYIFKNAESSTIRGCTSRHNGNRGRFGNSHLDRGGIGVQADHALIEGNVVHDNGTLRGDDAGGDDAIALSGCSRARVVRNAVFSSARGAIGMSHEPTSYGHEFSGNLIARWNLARTNQERPAIAVHAHEKSPPSAMKVCNNTIWSDQKTTTLVGLLLAQPRPSDVLRDSAILNNLIYLPHNRALDSRGIRLTRERQFDNVELDHNNVWLASGRNYEGFLGIFETAEAFCHASAKRLKVGYEEHGRNARPRFIKASSDPQQPQGFALARNSPLIDRGRNVGLTADFRDRHIPHGQAPDIGAFEWHPAQ
jgi:hypothetical protein